MFLPSPGWSKTGGFGKFRHGREHCSSRSQPKGHRGVPTAITLLLVRDFSIFEAGPADGLRLAGWRPKRFMAMQVVNEDQYTTGVYYGAGSHKPSTRGDESATRYGYCGRPLPWSIFSSREEIQQVARLAGTRSKSNQETGPARSKIPNWDEASSQERGKQGFLQLGTPPSLIRRAHVLAPTSIRVRSGEAPESVAAMLWGWQSRGKERALSSPITAGPRK